MKVWAHIANCLERTGACALITVTRVQGSSPREAGARMVVTGDGHFHGTIGGGTLELETIRKASKAVKAGDPGLSLQRVSLGPDLGQCCGGQVHIAIEVFSSKTLEEARSLAACEARGAVFSTRARVSDDRVGDREICTTPCKYPFDLKEDEKGGGRILFEQFGTERRPLYLFGAGHVGKALILALAPLPFEISWIDSRKDQFPGPVPANVRKIASPDPAKELDHAPDGAFVLAMTHSHALDEEIMARALLLQRFAYCGVIGSATKRARFQKRLKSRGLNETLIANMVCPVGVTALTSKQPAAIAAGVAVDLLMRDEASHQQVAAGGALAKN